MPSLARTNSRALQGASRRSVAGLVAGAVVLASAAVAAAAHPKDGAHFAGTELAAGEINGFKPPVTFTVSANGKELTNVRYSTLGCLGAGGFRPGVDYYTMPDSIIKVGTVNVQPSGSFSVTGVKSDFVHPALTIATTTKLSGSFTSATAAHGTIVFTQKELGANNFSCGPVTVSFKAKG